MRAVVQRVKQASVTVEDKVVGRIGPGMLVFLGVAKEDTNTDLEYLARKIAQLRIFEDPEGKMNLDPAEARAEILVVSQFTLLGNCDKGRRPSFDSAAGPEKAEDFYDRFVQQLRAEGFKVETGIFRAMMEVSLVNDGPVTLILESRS